MIDWDRINELKNEIGEEDFAEVVVLFLAEVEEVIDGFRDALNVTDLENKMHFLKGSALNLGFSDLADLCQDGEAKAKSGQSETVDIAAVISCYDSSKIVFETNEDVSAA